MGLIRLREEDLKLARSKNDEDPVLGHSWHANPHGLVQYYLDEAYSMGLAVVEKTSFWGRLSKMSTTYYKEIRLGTGWDSKTVHDKAILLAHEVRHARQWRRYGPGTFRAKYIFATRWRWAIEVQCYCESVRAMVALGASDAGIASYIDNRADDLWNKYAIKSLNKSDVLSNTKQILTAKALDNG